jgi:maltose/maltodextrin transport system substrate-binding protein
MKKLLVTLLCLAGYLYTAGAVQDGQLLIWINGDKAYTAVGNIGKKFAEETGIPVTVEHTDRSADQVRARRAIRQRAGHRHLGARPAGQLGRQRADSTRERRADYRAKFHAKSWEALTYEGKTWGYPVCLESVALIYNKAMVKESPATLAAIKPELAPYPILWAYDTPYFTWPFLAGAGGYVFKTKDGGGYDVSDIGVNQPGAGGGLADNRRYDQKGNACQRRHVRRHDRPDAAGQVRHDGQRTLGLERSEKSEHRLRHRHHSRRDGSRARQTVRRRAGRDDRRQNPNKELAELFIRDYLLTKDGLAAMDKDTYDGPHALLESYAVQKADPRVEASMKKWSWAC